MTSTTDLINAVEIYFDGIHECSTDKLYAVFHPASSVGHGHLAVEHRPHMGGSWLETASHEGVQGLE